MQHVNHRTIVVLLVVGLLTSPSLISGGVTVPASARPVSPSMATQSDDITPVLPRRHALGEPPTNTSTNGTVTFDNVTVEPICTDYANNTATFEIINTDDDTAQVYYYSPAAEGGAGGVTIAPGESVRVENMDTTGIATGLDAAAITLYIENSPRGDVEEGINYLSNPTPCGDAVADHPTIVFLNQTTSDTEDRAVTLDTVALPEGGFVVFSNESGAIIDVRYIGPGVANQVDTSLGDAFTNVTPGEQISLTATLYRDTNDNGAFDPGVDQPYESDCGDPSATATVTYSGDDS